MGTILKKVKAGKIEDIKINGNTGIDCMACGNGKMHRLPFKSLYEEKLQYGVGELFHTDICGPMSVTSLGGARYFVTFIDEASKYTKACFLKCKSNLYEVFQNFERFVANKLASQ